MVPAGAPPVNDHRANPTPAPPHPRVTAPTPAGGAGVPPSLPWAAGGGHRPPWRTRMIPEITPNARLVLEHRYLLKDDHGAVVETPDQLFRRGAAAIAGARRIPGGPAEAARTGGRDA